MSNDLYSNQFKQLCSILVHKLYYYQQIGICSIHVSITDYSILEKRNEIILFRWNGSIDELLCLGSE